MRQEKNPSKPKSSRSEKYTRIIKPIWNNREQSVREFFIEDEPTGSGVPMVILPSDPNELIDMLGLRMASFRAGNNGVRNEIVSICDVLKNMGVLDKGAYKTIMAQVA